jgi:hypothetical protein
MSALAIAILLIGGFSGSALADLPVSWSGPGGDTHSPAPGGREVCWSEPGDLKGILGSSEIISRFDLESEIANDFVVGDQLITKVTWWGGQYGTTSCELEWPVPGFNLRFYEDDNCAPGALLVELSITDFTEEFLVCGNNGFYPYYKYSADISVPVTPGVRYWFSAQFQDHPFPGQGGMMTTVAVIDCESMFRSDFFGFPVWTPSSVVWAAPYDFGQEFECGATATRSSTWGGIKSLYR